jgi:hypothetical protein
MPRRRGLVVSSPPVIEETGAMGREIESRQVIHKVVVFRSEKWIKINKKL